MKVMSGLDARFLYSETPTAHMHTMKVVVVDVEERGGQSVHVARLLSAILADWLLDLPGDAVTESDELLWNPSPGQVERCVRLRFGQLTIDESKTAARPDDPRAVELLANAASARPEAIFRDG